MFLHSFHPHPVLFELGPLTVHWYGFLIFLAILISFFVAKKLFTSYQLPLDKFYDLTFYLILFGLIGARLWHVFSELNYYLTNPLDILKIWNGGLAIHGAIVFGVITILVYSNNHPLTPSFVRRGEWKKKFLLLGDIFTPFIALGLALGRWGNYFNQELYGLPVSWGIPIDLAQRLPGFEQFEFFHPIFLYESLWCLLLFGFLIYLHRVRLKTGWMAGWLDGRMVKNSGAIFFLFLILYSIQRFLIGFLRIDPQFIFLNLRLDQWISALLIIISIIALISLSKRFDNQPQSTIIKDV